MTFEPNAEPTSAAWKTNKKNGNVSGEDMMRGIGEMTKDHGGPIARTGGMMTEKERKIAETGVKTTKIVGDSATNHRRAIMLINQQSGTQTVELPST